MKQIFRSMWRAVKKNMVSLLLFETGYRTASFLLVMHAVSAAVDYSLKAQNFSYLTAENYLKFLASPLSVVLLLGILILILLLFLIEISALLSCFRHSYQGRKIYTSDMLIEGVKRSWDFLKNSHVSWFWCIILAAPFLSIYFLIREISYIRVLEFTARQIYKIVSPHWILYGLIGIILLFSFLFIFSLPYCLLEEQKSRKGMKDGLKLLKRQWKKTLLGFVLLHIGMLVFIALVYVLVLAGMTGIAMLTKSGSSVVSSVLIYSSWIDMGLGIFAGAVQLICSLAFVYVVYARFHVQPRTEAAMEAIIRNHIWFSKVGRRKIAAALTLLLLLGEGTYLVVLASSHDSAVNSLLTTMGVTAHRGGALMAPENTISSLGYTIDSGADFAEIDVQETKDGELVLLHDNSLKRTAGVNKNVWEMDYAEIEKLDAGSSFHKKFRGEKIPTLDEVLKFCKGRLDLNIEIKYNGKNRGIVHKVVRAIRENGFEDYCVVTSMNYGFLEQIKETAPEIRTGYIMTMTYGSTANITAADFFSVKHTYVTESFVKEAHGMGKEIHAWTVNYRGDVRRMIDMGVDNIITDDPVMVRKVQGRESGSQTGYRELLGYALGI